MDISLDKLELEEAPVKYMEAFKSSFGERTVPLTVVTLSEMCRKIPLFWIANRFLPLEVSQEYQNLMTPHAVEREDFIKSLSALNPEEAKQQEAPYHEKYLVKMVTILAELIERHGL